MSADRVFKPGSLVVYKNSPARVAAVGAKIEIEPSGRPALLVRSKDIIFLHPGPVASAAIPELPEGDLREAWEMLQGSTTTLNQFAELLYGEVTPAAAWAVYRLLLDGLYARGNPDEVYVLSREEHEAEAAARGAKSRDAAERLGFLERVRGGIVVPEDAKLLRELEDFAYGRSGASRTLKELGIPNTMENAHSLLLKLGVWDAGVNPHVRRLGLALEAESAPLGTLPDEERLDLTGLAAFAIDDEGNEDPDDAVSFDGERLWVHVSDPAAIVRPGTPADLLARSRGANLYLPEKKVPMLPPEATAVFGLGLAEVSPALSFGIRLNEDGSPAEAEIRLSRVRVTRITYEEAQRRLGAPPLREIFAFTSRYNAYRKRNGAIFIRLPDVKIRVVDGQVSIRPLPETDAGTMVSDAMLMAGEAVARFALDNLIPMPYASQEPPDSPCDPRDLAAMYQCRRKLRASSVRSSPSPHSGLGLQAYTRTTSPLRRYLDLVAHQQIRGFLTGTALLDADEMTERIGASDAVTGTVGRAERLSNLHWTIVYLMQNPGKRFKGIIVENQGRSLTALLPELGLETKMNSSRGAQPNDEITLICTGTDLPNLTVHFEAE